MRIARYLGGLLCGMGLAVITACGSPGIPRPPSLNLPEPVSDLRAVRKGDRVFLMWSMPTENTDGTLVRHLGLTGICRSLDQEVKNCTNAVHEVPEAQLEGGKSQTVPTTQKKSANPPSTSQKQQAVYVDDMPKEYLTPNPAAMVFYAVCVLNPKGRTAGLSNQVSVPAVLGPPPPANFQAQLTAGGVVLTWTAVPNVTDSDQLRHRYRIYRRLEGTTTDTMVGEVPFDTLNPTRFVDHDFQWEKTYLYRLTVVTMIRLPGKPETEFESDDTPEQKVVAHDIFPPAVPTGLQAVFSGVGQQPFIDLVWIPDIDIDLAGYNVYRREDGSQIVKINSELVKNSAFRDSNLASGHTYFYSVSAVDIRGNESARSQEARETVP
jgi:hypothetical protein